jgi:cytochrome c-type biogenesis protein CcmH/NrfF
MIDTQTVLWIIPPVLVAIALLAKFLVHRTKLLAERQQSSEKQVSAQPASKARV